MEWTVPFAPVVTELPFTAAVAELPGLELHWKVPAANWCVNCTDLRRFEQTLREWCKEGRIPQSDTFYNPFHEDPSVGPSMYQVVDHFIKPVTKKKGGMSYALMLHPEGLPCHVFVTHAWAEGVFEFCSKIRRAWPLGAKNLWCCFLANPQNADISDLIGGSVLESPFARAILSPHCTHVVAIPNKTVSIYTRLWCVLEADLAIREEMPVTLPPISSSYFLCAVLKGLASTAFSAVCATMALLGDQLPHMIFGGVSLAIWVASLGALLNPHLKKEHSHSVLSALHLWVTRWYSGARVSTSMFNVSKLFSGRDRNIVVRSSLASRCSSIVLRVLQPFNYLCNIFMLFVGKDRNIVARSSLTGLCFAFLLRVIQFYIAYYKTSSPLFYSCGTTDEMEKARRHQMLWTIVLTSITALALLFIDGVAHQLYKDALKNEAQMLNFETVKNAKCYSDSDAQRIWTAVRGREQQIDEVVKRLQTVGIYDASVRDDLDYGFDPAHGRLLNPVRAIMACVFWGLFLTANPGPREPATPIGYFMHRGPIRTVMIGSVVPMLSAAAAAVERPHQRRAAYAFHSMWQGGLWLLGVYAALAVGSELGFFALHPFCFHLQWSYIFVYKIALLRGLFGPSGIYQLFNLMRTSKGRQRHRCSLAFTTLSFLTTVAAYILHRSFPWFAECVRTTNLTENMIRNCAHTWIILFASTTASLVVAWYCFTRIVHSLSRRVELQKRHTAEGFVLEMVSIPSVGSATKQILGQEVLAQPPLSSPSPSTERAACRICLTLVKAMLQIMLIASIVSICFAYRQGTGQVLHSLAYHSIRVVTFSPDGQSVLTGSIDGLAHLWSSSSGDVLRVLKGHSHTIVTVAFSADGKMLLTGSDDNTVRLWSASSGAALCILKGGPMPISTAALSPDAQRVVTGHEDGTTRIWSTSTCQMLGLLSDPPGVGGRYSVSQVAFSPTGRTLFIMSSAGDLELFNSSSRFVFNRSDPDLFQPYYGRGIINAVFSADGETLLAGTAPPGTFYLIGTRTKSCRKFAGHTGAEALTALAISPNKGIVVTGDFRGAVRMWNAQTGNRLRSLSHHWAQVTAVAFSPGGEALLTGSRDKTAIIWSVSNGKPICILRGHAGPVVHVQFSPTEQVVLTHDQSTVRLWVWDGLEQVLAPTVSGHDAPLNAVDISPDGQVVVTAGEDLRAVLWRVSDGRKLHYLLGHRGSVSAARFSPDGRSVLTGSYDGVYCIWNASDGRPLHLRKFGPYAHVTVAVFSPDGRSMLTASLDGSVRVSSAADASPLQEMMHDAQVVAGCYSSDAQRVLTGSWDKTARLWSIATGECVHIFEHSDLVSSVAISHDGKIVITGSFDESAHLWSATTGDELYILDHPDQVHVVAFSPDGQTVVTGCADSIVRLWSSTSGDLLHKLVGHSGLVTAAIFSPRGHYVISGSQDSTVRLWSTSSGDLLHIFDGHYDEVTDVVLSRCGKFVLTGSKDRSANLWEISTGRQIEAFGLGCGRWLATRF